MQSHSECKKKLSEKFRMAWHQAEKMPKKNGRGFLSWTQNWFLHLIRLYLVMSILVPVTQIVKGLLFASAFSAHKILLKAGKDLTMQTISFRDLPFSVLNYLLQIHWRIFLSESGPLSGWERLAAHTESAERASVFVQSAGLQLHCNSPEDTKGQSKTQQFNDCPAVLMEPLGWIQKKRLSPAGFLQLPLDSSGNQPSLHIHSDPNFPKHPCMPDICTKKAPHKR